MRIDIPRVAALCILALSSALPAGLEDTRTERICEALEGLKNDLQQAMARITQGKPDGAQNAYPAALSPKKLAPIAWCYYLYDHTISQLQNQYETCEASSPDTLQPLVTEHAAHLQTFADTLFPQLQTTETGFYQAQGLKIDDPSESQASAVWSLMQAHNSPQEFLTPKDLANKYTLFCKQARIQKRTIGTHKLIYVSFALTSEPGAFITRIRPSIQSNGRLHTLLLKSTSGTPYWTSTETLCFTQHTPHNAATPWSVSLQTDDFTHYTNMYTEEQAAALAQLWDTTTDALLTAPQVVPLNQYITLLSANPCQVHQRADIAHRQGAHNEDIVASLPHLDVCLRLIGCGAPIPPQLADQLSLTILGVAASEIELTGCIPHAASENVKPLAKHIADRHTLGELDHIQELFTHLWDAYISQQAKPQTTPKRATKHKKPKTSKEKKRIYGRHAAQHRHQPPASHSPQTPQDDAEPDSGLVLNTLDPKSAEGEATQHEIQSTKAKSAYAAPSLEASPNLLDTRSAGSCAAPPAARKKRRSGPTPSFRDRLNTILRNNPALLPYLRVRGSHIKVDLQEQNAAKADNSQNFVAHRSHGKAHNKGASSKRTGKKKR